MRAGPPDKTLAGAVTWRPVLSSWLADQLLADSIPVSSGQFVYDVTQQIPERLTFTVPESVDGFSWIPDTYNHPLAKFGQQLSLIIDVNSAVSQQDWQVQIATLQIQDWQHDDIARTVTVEALGLFQIAADASFITPEAPRTTDTFVSAFTRLLPAGLGVQFDPSLVDRALPQSFQWDQDRLAALYDIADAWPARIRVDEFGTVQVLPPLGVIGQPVMTFTEGVNGTLISAPSADTRDQIYNTVVCTSSNTDSTARAPVQAVAQVIGGPLDPTGPYGYVVRYYSSPLVTSQGQCLAAAQAILAQSILPALSKVASIAPDPRPEVDDPVALIQDGDDGDVLTLGWVLGYQMPLTITDGNMQLTVGSSAA